MKTNTSTSQSPNNWMTAVQLPHDWTNVSFGAPDLRLCRITYQDLPGSSPLVVTRSLIVKQDHSWVLNVHGHTVDASKVPFLRTLPVELNSDSATLLLSRLSRRLVIAGTPLRVVVPVTCGYVQYMYMYCCVNLFVHVCR